MDALAALELRPLNGDERRAESFQAREVLVARRLVDGALAAPFGFERLHRNAVRLDAAIAATFTHEFVDDHALVGIGKCLAFAPPAFLRRASLIIDQNRRARNGGEFL